MALENNIEGTIVNARDERGAVMILIAILGTVLLMFVAYAIDLSMYANAREAAAQYSRLAALSAVEGYFASTKTTEQEKVNDALLRANQITLSNTILDAQSASRPSSAHNIVLFNAPSADEATNALLTPGRWYFRMPTGTAADDVACTPPCFQQVEPGQTANAIRISGTLYTSTLSNIARTAFGTGELPAKVAAVASVVPRHGCFLVDLSPSITATTHLDRDAHAQVESPAEGFGRTFGFYLSRDNGLAASAGGYDDAERRCISTTSPYLLHDCWWDVLETYHAARPAGGEDDDFFPQKHYAQDYRLMRLMGDRSYGLNPDFIEHHPNPNVAAKYSARQDGQWVHVDAFREDNHYDGPEPLQTILSGLRAAIAGFRKRAVAGDKLCLIFYDQTLSWPRIVKLTDDFDYLERFTSTDYLIPPGNDPLDISPGELAVHDKWFETIVRHGIFPTNNGLTNIQLALSEASDQLSDGAETGVPSSDFVVLIGDGMTNCPSEGDCGNSYDIYARAMADLKDYVSDNFVPADIPIHVILAGEHVAPHTVLRQRSDGTCYTSADARKEKLPHVIGGGADGNPFPTMEAAKAAFENASSTTPFFQVNADMFEIAAATRGIWAPLRKPSAGCIRRTVDGFGRLQCGEIATERRETSDPLCRPIDEQMDAYIDEIVGLNPYALVSLE